MGRGTLLKSAKRELNLTWAFLLRFRTSNTQCKCNLVRCLVLKWARWLLVHWMRN